MLALLIQASYTTWHLMQELGWPLHAASGRAEGHMSPGVSEAAQLQMQWGSCVLCARIFHFVLNLLAPVAP